MILPAMRLAARMHMANESATQGQGTWRSRFEWALDETERVATRLEEEFAKVPLLQFLSDQLGGLVYNAAQKLIDRAAAQAQRRSLDEAIIRSCSRLFTDCMGGYVLLRRGLILPAASLLRAALETTMQAIMFLEQPAKADQWLQGMKFKPSHARSASAVAASLYDGMYKRLSDIAHPSVAASFLHTVPLPQMEPDALALLYGGWFAPRTAGATACEFLRLQLAFLRAFYEHYESQLAELSLLFRPETLAAFQAINFDPNNLPFRWKHYFDLLAALLDEVEHTFQALPADDQATADWIQQLQQRQGDRAPSRPRTSTASWSSVPTSAAS